MANRRTSERADYYHADTMRCVNRIKTLIEESDFTMEELAGYLRVSVRQLQRYKYGVSEIPIAVAYHLCLIFDVSMDDLFE